jgi:hypothetical protein
MTRAEIHSWSRDMMQVVADYFEKFCAVKTSIDIQSGPWNLAQRFVWCYETWRRTSLCVMKCTEVHSVLWNLRPRLTQCYETWSWLTHWDFHVHSRCPCSHHEHNGRDYELNMNMTMNMNMILNMNMNTCTQSCMCMHICIYRMSQIYYI